MMEIEFWLTLPIYKMYDKNAFISQDEEDTELNSF